MLLSSPNQLKHPPQRIVSLVPSQTELLCDLGLAERVAGITKFCVHPPAWRKTKLIVGGTKSIHVKKIASLRPDLVIANREENVKEQVETIAGEFDVWVTDVNSLHDALLMIRDAGRLTQTVNAAGKMITEIQQRFAGMPTCREKTRVAYLIWKDPFMVAGGGTFINDMLERCGFDNVFANRQRYPVVTLEELALQQCELLILSSEPYPFTPKHFAPLQQQLPKTKIIAADGEMFSWYGSRLLQAPGYFTKLVEQLY